MDEDERGLFDELIASVECGLQGNRYTQLEQMAQESLSTRKCDVTNPEPHTPLTLEQIESIHDNCPAESD
jgi:hypothetical protein